MCKYPQHPKTMAVVRRAREIIADPARWTPALRAVDASGLEVNGRHAKAVRFSGVGALDRAALLSIRLSSDRHGDLCGCPP